MKIKHIILISTLFILETKSYALINSFVNETTNLKVGEIFKPIYGKNGIVVTEEEIASKVGAKILSQGGNAVDAAVAVGYALAVTYPEAGNIGGGGFMMIWLNKEKKAIAINYREKAPKLATKDMFLNAKGNVNDELVDKSYLSTGVPGTVYGLNHALKKYGTLPLETVMKPAIDLAKNGFIVTHAFSNAIEDAKELLSTSAESKKIYFSSNNEAKKIGELFVQSDLANTLEKIAKEGSSVFYQGEIADKIVNDMKENKGIITKEDLENYKAEEVTPIFGRYRV